MFPYKSISIVPKFFYWYVHFCEKEVKSEGNSNLRLSVVHACSGIKLMVGKLNFVLWDGELFYQPTIT